jgi:hypothetical protein
VLAVVLPAAAAVLWATFASPRAPVELPVWPKTLVRCLVLLGSALALGVAGEVVLAVVFAAVVVADQAAMIALGEPVAGATT